jgi:glycine/D-amino acid oxidase-like deaminating enzyme
MYDTIIIGSGIAGLYAAYKLRKAGNDSFLVLEKTTAEEKGGRMGTRSFHGVPVAIGAGVGRKRKDKRLAKLLNELGVKYTEGKHTSNYSPVFGTQCNVRDTFLALKKAFLAEQEKHTEKTFREFARPILGDKAYVHFVQCVGYADYENESAESTLLHYGFNDNYDHWTAMYIPWNDVLAKLLDSIGRPKIRYNQTVVEIVPGCQKTTMDPILVKTREKTYECRNVVIATTVSTVRQLLPKHAAVYKHIHAQPFMRIYGKFDAASAKIMRERIPTTVIVPGDLQKLIPIRPEKGVYMIAYADNAGAHSLLPYAANTAVNRSILAAKIEKALGFPSATLVLADTVSFYWKEGTHYYSPGYNTISPNRETFIRMAQFPCPNVFVVGEMVAQNQGWVEGALESVDTIF